MEACQSSSSFPFFYFFNEIMFRKSHAWYFWTRCFHPKNSPSPSLSLFLFLALSISLPPLSFPYRLYVCICLLISQHAGENFPSIGKKPDRNRVTTPSRDPSPNRRKRVPSASTLRLEFPSVSQFFFFSSAFLFFFFFFESFFYFIFSSLRHPVTTVKQFPINRAASSQ